MSNIRFNGILPALVTPLDGDGRVRRNAVRPLTDYMLDMGADGFYICGSTGEGPVLSRFARMDMAEATVLAVRDRLTDSQHLPWVIVHVGAPNPDDAFALAKHAESVGADAVSSLAPSFYFQYNDDEMVEYYKRLADTTELPILVYCTPQLKTPDLRAFFERIMEIPGIIGLKYTVRDYFPLSRIREINGGDINLINGPDETLLAGLAMGAHGGIGTTYNVMPEKFARLYREFRQGDLKSARATQGEINRIIDAMLRFDHNVVNTTKAMLRLMGFDTGSAVYPARDFSEEEMARLEDVMTEAGFCF